LHRMYRSRKVRAHRQTSEPNLLDILLDPLRQNRRNLQVVELQHDHVAIDANPCVLQPH